MAYSAAAAATAATRTADSQTPLTEAPAEVAPFFGGGGGKGGTATYTNPLQFIGILTDRPLVRRR